MGSTTSTGETQLIKSGLCKASTVFQSLGFHGYGKTLNRIQTEWLKQEKLLKYQPENPFA